LRVFKSFWRSKLNVLDFVVVVVSVLSLLLYLASPDIAIVGVAIILVRLVQRSAIVWQSSRDAHDQFVCSTNAAYLMSTGT
jgi:hypothetical protein